jgi:hypothetical protein
VQNQRLTDRCKELTTTARVLQKKLVQVRARSLLRVPSGFARDLGKVVTPPCVEADTGRTDVESCWTGQYELRVRSLEDFNDSLLLRTQGDGAMLAL